MQFLQTFQLYDFLDTLVSLFVAFVFGAMIGAERQYRQRSAALRTNVLVSVGAAAFVDLGNHVAGADGSVRVIAYVVSGIGFLGAGAIMKEGMNVRGRHGRHPMGFGGCGILCWCRHGCTIHCAHAVRYRRKHIVAAIGDAIDRIPLNEHASEANYEVIVTTDASSAAEVRDILNERLDAAKYPIRETNVVHRSNDNVEISARLVSLSVDPRDLDTVVAELSKVTSVSHATWNVSALE